MKLQFSFKKLGTRFLSPTLSFCLLAGTAYGKSSYPTADCLSSPFLQEIIDFKGLPFVKNGKVPLSLVLPSLFEGDGNKGSNPLKIVFSDDISKLFDIAISLEGNKSTRADLIRNTFNALEGVGFSIQQTGRCAYRIQGTGGKTAGEKVKKYTEFSVPVRFYPVEHHGRQTKAIRCGEETFHINNKPIIDQKSITAIEHDANALRIRFSESGTKLLYQVTHQLMGKKLALVIGERCVWVAKVFEAIQSGQVQVAPFPMSDAELSQLLQNK